MNYNREPKGVSTFINAYLETVSLDLEYISYGEFRTMIVTFIKESEPNMNVFSSFLHVLSSRVSPNAGSALRSHLRVFSKEVYTKADLTV